MACPNLLLHNVRVRSHPSPRFFLLFPPPHLGTHNAPWCIFHPPEPCRRREENNGIFIQPADCSVNCLSSLALRTTHGCHPSDPKFPDSSRTHVPALSSDGSLFESVLCLICSPKREDRPTVSQLRRGRQADRQATLRPEKYSSSFFPLYHSSTLQTSCLWCRVSLQTP